MSVNQKTYITSNQSSNFITDYNALYNQIAKTLNSKFYKPPEQETKSKYNMHSEYTTSYTISSTPVSQSYSSNSIFSSDRNVTFTSLIG